MAKVTDKAPAEGGLKVAETKVEQGSEPLNKTTKNEPVKREVLPDGTIVEHY